MRDEIRDTVRDEVRVKRAMNTSTCVSLKCKYRAVPLRAFIDKIAKIKIYSCIFPKIGMYNNNNIGFLSWYIVYIAFISMNIALVFDSCDMHAF